MNVILIRSCTSALFLLMMLPWNHLQADIVPDNCKGVEFDLSFEGMERFPEYTFLLYPTRFSSSAPAAALCKQVGSGEPVEFYHMVSPRLYAVRRGTAPADELFEENSMVPRSNTVIFQSRLVWKKDPIQSIRRVYRITGVEGRLVKLERYDDVNDTGAKLMDPFERRARTGPVPGSNNKWVLIAAAALFVGLVCFFAVARAKRWKLV